MFALITGASRGIGAATARRLAGEGYQIAVHYHKSKEQAEALAAELRGIAVQADLSDISQIDRMTDEVVHTFGRIDLLVNNAGVALEGLFHKITDADALYMLSVNIGGVIHTTKRVLPVMLQGHHGCIINVSSVWGEIGAACEVHYSASKAAIIGFTKALAKEVGPSGIRVNCVSPGVIDTDMNKIYDSETMQMLADETPLSRLGQAEEVAGAIAFLASEQAQFITGQILSVNGGFHG